MPTPRHVCALQDKTLREAVCMVLDGSALQAEAAAPVRRPLALPAPAPGAHRTRIVVGTRLLPRVLPAPD